MTDASRRDPVVTLTWSELRSAAMVGVTRRVQDMAKGLKDAHGASDGDRWDRDIEGAAGEMAFAKWANMFWSGALGDLKADDVGDVQIRTSAYASGRLILHPADPDDRIFVLVTGIGPRYTLRGWLHANEGKAPHFWQDPTGKNRHAFFVPGASLRPMSQFPGRKN